MNQTIKHIHTTYRMTLSYLASRSNTLPLLPPGVQGPGGDPWPECKRDKSLRPIFVLRFMDFRGVDSSRILLFKGWNSHVHRNLPEKFESTYLSRHSLSREIGRTPSRWMGLRVQGSGPILLGSVVQAKTLAHVSAFFIGIERQTTKGSH